MVPVYTLAVRGLGKFPGEASSQHLHWAGNSVQLQKVWDIGRFPWRKHLLLQNQFYPFYSCPGFTKGRDRGQHLAWATLKVYVCVFLLFPFLISNVVAYLATDRWKANGNDKNWKQEAVVYGLFLQIHLRTIRTLWETWRFSLWEPESWRTRYLGSRDPLHVTWQNQSFSYFPPCLRRGLLGMGEMSLRKKVAIYSTDNRPGRFNFLSAL